MALIALFAIFGASLVFQIAHLDTLSLWHDEAFSALLIQYENYGEMLHRIALDVHPPLYYMILRAWNDIFGHSVFSLRFFSLFFGLLSIVATFMVAKEIFQNKKLALLSALIFGMSSFQVQYNLEARMYTLGAFFLLLATYFLFRGLKAQIPSKKFFLLITIYALFAAAAVYTHYYTIFALAAHAFFSLYWLRSQIKKQFLVGTGFFISGVLFLPWLPVFLRQLAQVQESYWIPPINAWSLLTTLSKMVTGDGLDPNQAAFLIILIAILVLAAFFSMLFLYPQKERWILPLLFFTPFLGSLLLSLKTSIYLDRYFILYLPYLMITLVAALFAIPQKKLRFGLLTLALIGAAVSYPLHEQVWRLSEKPGMQAAALHLLSSASPNDIVLVNSPFVFFTFRYYNEGRLPDFLYAPEELSHFSGTALLNDSDIVRSFGDGSTINSIIWTIDTTGFGNFQPTVPASWQKLEEMEFPDAYIHRGSIIIRKYIVQN